MTTRPLDTREFFRLLHGRTKRSADRVDTHIRQRAEREVTVFVCDTSGFTRKTHDYGIHQFLAVMTRGYRSLTPIFRKCRGLIVSQTADNLLAVFSDPHSAVRASVEIQRKLRKANEGKHDRDQFHLSIGIECGPAIVLTDNIYGPSVNVPSKAGWSLAAKARLLLLSTLT